MNINRTTPHEPEPRKSEKGKRIFLGGLLAAVTLAGGLTFASEVLAIDEGEPGPPEMVTICHVAGRADDPANHITMTISENAVYGRNENAGHFNEDGTPQAGHELDTFGPCAPQPKDEVTSSDPVCGSNTVKVTTITYSRNEAGKWVANAPVDTPRDLTDEEKAGLEESCTKADEVTFSDWKGEPVCDAKTVAQARTKTTISYTYDADTGLFVAGTPAVVTESQTPVLAASEFKACPITTPPAAQTQVASNSPVVPAAVAPAAPAAVVAATPTQLPSTGSSSWVTALIALVTLAGGTGLVRLSRRPTD